ncbi:MAG: NAD(P)H-binding protein, partial [Candidatus Omnitrophica bacterium]|nr:NAD(P)H-binding protein [Candidatus Omnitrophota bacterium]
MSNSQVHVVTGAFGYSGKYLALRLLSEGYEVRTLTNSPDRPNLFAGRVKAYPYNFDNPEKLVESLRGVSVLYNTYWVRFNYKNFTHAQAVQNTFKLFNAAKEAGIKRIVHISIANPSKDSPFEYFRGKAQIEERLIESGISYAILRPAVLFGKEDILINNIAWMLRNLPVLGMFGDGKYRLQPIYVDDLAEIAVEQGKKRENCIIDAIGPETFTYRDLVERIGEIIGKRKPIVPMPPGIGYLFTLLLGRMLRDIIVTRDEIGGLMANLLYTNSPPAGKTKLTDWVKENAGTLGVHYA